MAAGFQNFQHLMYGLPNGFQALGAPSSYGLGRRKKKKKKELIAKSIIVEEVTLEAPDLEHELVLKKQKKIAQEMEDLIVAFLLREWWD